MTAAEVYGEYLMRRSRLSGVYRRYFLYPRICHRLHGRTVDVGCGIGDFLQFRPNTIGVDINAHTVAYCKARGLDARLMEPDVLPFEDGSFDSALMDNWLEHIAKPAPASILRFRAVPEAALAAYVLSRSTRGNPGGIGARSRAPTTRGSATGRIRWPVHRRPASAPTRAQAAPGRSRFGAMD